MTAPVRAVIRHEPTPGQWACFTGWDDHTRPCWAVDPSKALVFWSKAEALRERGIILNHMIGRARREVKVRALDPPRSAILDDEGERMPTVTNPPPEASI